MGFKEVTPTLKPAATPGAVKFSVKTAKKNTAFRAELTMPMQVMVAADFTDGDRFKMLVGEGADAGKVRLVKNAAGVVTLKYRAFGSKGITVGWITLGDFEGVPRAKVDSTPIAHTVIPNGIDLAIPALGKPGFQSIMR